MKWRESQPEYSTKSIQLQYQRVITLASKILNNHDAVQQTQTSCWGHLCVILNTALARIHVGASLAAHKVKNSPAGQETRVRSLSWVDPLEKGKATHPSILAGRISQTGRLAGYSPWGCKESDTTELLSLWLFTCGYRSESGVVEVKNVCITIMNPSSEAKNLRGFMHNISGPKGLPQIYWGESIYKYM